MNNDKDKYIIIVDEEDSEVSSVQEANETPVITIEESYVASEKLGKPVRRWKWFVGGLVISALLCIAALVGWWYYRTYVNIGIPVSISSKENIDKLQTLLNVDTCAGVIMTSDSILGVGLNFYEIRGLKAEISFEEPKLTDSDVYLYARCSDFSSYDPKENIYLGSLVVDGKVFQSDNSRLGYCAMINGNVVIGIARDEIMMDYCVEQGGSFFRQFVLVSSGVLPPTFHLHGKVERKALGRIGDKLYYIESRNKEVMWAFADALREYGFVDAIYITGGSDYCYYRDVGGNLHDIGDTERKGVEHPGKGIVPWMVFRKVQKSTNLNSYNIK